MPLFYLCPELGCNRKYKTAEMIKKHLLEVHEVLDPVIGEPVEVTQANKKQVEGKKNRNKQQELYDQRVREIEARKKLQEEAKKEAEEKFRQEQMEIVRRIEEEKLRVQQQELELQKKKQKVEQQVLKSMEDIDQIHNRIRENPTECCLCMDATADTAVIPCGHKYFCYDCAEALTKGYARRGCPACRKEIVMITKIYG